MTVNEELRSLVVEGLQKNIAKYGAPYCPCKVQRVDENICPCLEFRTQGICECGLYEVKKGGR